MPVYSINDGAKSNNFASELKFSVRSAFWLNQNAGMAIVDTLASALKKTNHSIIKKLKCMYTVYQILKKR